MKTTNLVGVWVVVIFGGVGVGVDYKIEDLGGVALKKFRELKYTWLKKIPVGQLPPLGCTCVCPCLVFPLLNYPEIAIALLFIEVERVGTRNCTIFREYRGALLFNKGLKCQNQYQYMPIAYGIRNQ